MPRADRHRRGEAVDFPQLGILAAKFDNVARRFILNTLPGCIAGSALRLLFGRCPRLENLQLG